MTADNNQSQLEEQPNSPQIPNYIQTIAQFTASISQENKSVDSNADRSTWELDPKEQQELSEKSMLLADQLIKSLKNSDLLEQQIKNSDYQNGQETAFTSFTVRGYPMNPDFDFAPLAHFVCIQLGAWSDEIYADPITGVVFDSSSVPERFSDRDQIAPFSISCVEIS